MKQLKLRIQQPLVTPFSGVARLQMANEGSGKKNIEALLNKLAELNIEANEVSLTQ